MYGIYSRGYETIGNHSINSATHMTYTTLQYTVFIYIHLCFFDGLFPNNWPYSYPLTNASKLLVELTK